MPRSKARVRAPDDPWRSTPEAARHRRHVNLTLSREALVELDRRSVADGVSRSVLVERLVMKEKRWGQCQ